MCDISTTVVTVFMITIVTKDVSIVFIANNIKMLKYQNLSKFKKYPNLWSLPTRGVKQLSYAKEQCLKRVLVNALHDFLNIL